MLLLAGTTAAAAADKITFVTDYGLYGRHAYYFVAIEKGYYARENLDVDIVRSPGSAQRPSDRLPTGLLRSVLPTRSPSCSGAPTTECR